MPIDENVTKAEKLYASADESEWASPRIQYRIKDATFLMLRVTASRMGLTPELSDDVRQAYELYRKADESAWTGPKTQYNLMDACYHLAKAIQEKTE